MKWIVVACAILVGGCDPASGPLAFERQYEIMQRSHAGPGELCAKAREVANAWLAQEDERKFQIWDLTSKVECMAAEMEKPPDYH